ncbi:MAG: 50S ribosomal protein L11 methyltransferase [bacterium]|nr:50S ribosomal protein L11 methyltransferase [bacterium]
MKEKWIEVSLAVPEEFVQIVENQLSQLGSVGNTEYIKKEEDEIKKASPVIKGYFSETGGAGAEKVESLRAFLSSLKALFPDANIGQIETKETCEDDWQEWRRFFKPVLVSRRVVIKPTWEEYELKENELIVDIDPGMAFGTGTHETTRLCIQLLDNIIKGGETVFDVGTGSGILAIAAAKLGAVKVLGIDNDERSVSVAVENVELNSADKKVIISGTPLSGIEGSFDIVVANILAEDLIEMRKELMKRLAGSGRLILSGILKSKAEMVIAAFDNEGAILEEQIDDGEWSALMLKR